MSRYIRLIVAEALRLYPQPPLLIRRSLRPDTLPGKLLHRLGDVRSMFAWSTSTVVMQKSGTVQKPTMTSFCPLLAGGNKGDPAGYSLPAGTDIFISVRKYFEDSLKLA